MELFLFFFSPQATPILVSDEILSGDVFAAVLLKLIGNKDPLIIPK